MGKFHHFFFERVINPRHGNGGVLSFHVLLDLSFVGGLILVSDQ